MQTRWLLAAAALAAGVAAGAQERAPQYRIQPLMDLTGAPGVSLAVRRLSTTGTFMHTAAHPDDENNAVLALYAQHFGMRVAMVTATRGDGGQNEIGPELFDALGILRTEELLTAHRFDGAEQYFTRAVDFGFSFSQEETFEKWGRKEILGDFVRHIRAIRPDVIVSLGIDGTGGGQHHQASGVLTAEAFKAAADPAQFPDQIRSGLRPWQVKKLYRPSGGIGSRVGTPAPDSRLATLDTNIYEPLLGCTISEVGSVASGMHMCQGRAPLVSMPGTAGGPAARYRLVDTVLPAARDKDESSLFEGIDTSLAGLARYTGASPPRAVVSGLATIASRVSAVARTLANADPSATVPDLVAGLNALRDLRSGLGSTGLADDARFEIDFRLAQKEAQFQRAIVLAHALRMEATANDGLVVPGQPVTVNVIVANRGRNDVMVRGVRLRGLDVVKGCAPGSVTDAAAYACSSEVRVPRAARLTGPYWDRPENAGRAIVQADAPSGLPFRPTPFRARIELVVGGAEIVHEQPIQFRYDGAGLAGEKRMELNVVPSFAVSVSPKILVVPRKSVEESTNGAGSTTDARGRELRVTVINGTKGATAATVRLNTPARWQVSPASAALTFAREDEAVTTRFTITPAQVKTAGVRIREEDRITAQVESSNEASPRGAFDSGFLGYQVIEYPHIQRRHKVIAAEAVVKVIDVAIAPSLTVGYIVGVGDQVPPALQQLGARVNFIDSDELAWGDLSKYDTIVTGVRAYERRDDLRANNQRLLKYVEDGGTVIVQYNKMEFNQSQYGPYKAVVSSNRITDENAPVTVLVPNHPVFNYPNRIGERDWQGWVQERGLYFLGERDPRYVDLVQMEDPFEYNKGVKTGALVEARYGKGRWLYVGLGFWRQLPSGTDGAYRLFANLVSLGKPR